MSIPSGCIAFCSKPTSASPRISPRCLGMEGVGARTLRALSLVGELVYGAPVSITDPARFSFAHGGKDGHPYPVDKKTYDKSIETLHTAVRQAKIGQREQVEALKRLTQWTEEGCADCRSNCRLQIVEYTR